HHRVFPAFRRNGEESLSQSADADERLYLPAYSTWSWPRQRGEGIGRPWLQAIPQAQPAFPERRGHRGRAMVSPFLCLDLKGTPAERGEAYGAAARRQIRAARDYYLKNWGFSHADL